MTGNRIVLIIEDTVLVRETLRDMLKVDGFEVHECGDGKSALDAAAKRDFHIIITDYRMPNMNGVEATKQLRLRFPASVIIGLSSDDRRADFLKAGADAFLLKPYEYDDLIDLLKGF